MIERIIKIEEGDRLHSERDIIFTNKMPFIYIRNSLIEKELENFKEFGCQLEAEGWEFEKIFDILRIYINTKFGML